VTNDAHDDGRSVMPLDERCVAAHGRQCLRPDELTGGYLGIDGTGEMLRGAAGTAGPSCAASHHCKVPQHSWVGVAPEPRSAW
jgi:hypothetical protein